MVLDTSGILSSKLQNSLICQDHFWENYFTSSQKTRFCRCAVPFPSVFRSKFKVSQNNSVMIWIHYFFRQIFEPAQNGNKCGRDRHRIGGALRCDFLLAERFGMQTVRVPVGRVPQIKHTCEGRKIPFIKNACNNFDEKEIETNTKDRN
jgi:hypothetical protein